MTIKEFVRTIWGGKYYVVVAVLVVIVGAGLHQQRQSTLYEATAEVQLSEQTDSPVAEEGGSAAAVPATVTVNPDPKLVTAPQTMAAAARELGLAGDPSALQSRVSAEYHGDLRTMHITSYADDPSAAVAQANAFASAYADSLDDVRDAEVAAINTNLADIDARLKGLSTDPSNPIDSAKRDQLTKRIDALVSRQVALDEIAIPGQVKTQATAAKPQGNPTSVVLSVAGLVGLVIGVGVAFARRGLDTRLRTAHEAAIVAQVPVLTELYEVRGADQQFHRSGLLPVSSRDATPFTESIRELRTAIQVSVGAVEHAVVAVTSADSHSPRAFITANLAVSFALSGRPTVIVPGDLRRRELDALLPPPPDWHGDLTAMRPTRIPQLTVLPVDNELLDPADFLATVYVREQIAAQRDTAVVVVIDSPPVLAAADATILGGYSQCAVLVATVGRTHRAVLREAAERLRTNHVPLAGVALMGPESGRRMLYASTYGRALGKGAYPLPGADNPGPPPLASVHWDPATRKAEPPHHNPTPVESLMPDLHPAVRAEHTGLQDHAPGPPEQAPGEPEPSGVHDLYRASGQVPDTGERLPPTSAAPPQVPEWVSFEHASRSAEDVNTRAMPVIAGGAGGDRSLSRRRQRPFRPPSAGPSRRR